MLNKSTLLRLQTQLDVLPFLLSDAQSETIRARPPSGQWSALENLAHLARHHEVFLVRLRRILSENAPQLEQYRADKDAAWPEWTCLTLEEVLGRLKVLRKEVTDLVRGLTAAEADRVGIHSLYGKMSLALWVEFFLLHEAHHLYVVMTRISQVKRSLSTQPTPSDDTL